MEISFNILTMKKKYFKPLMFSFLPSLLVVIIVCLVTLDLELTKNLLINKEGSSTMFRIFLISLEIVSYFTFLSYFENKEIKKINGGIFEQIVKERTFYMESRTTSDDYIRFDIRINSFNKEDIVKALFKKIYAQMNELEKE